MQARQVSLGLSVGMEESEKVHFMVLSGKAETILVNANGPTQPDPLGRRFDLDASSQLKQIERWTQVGHRLQ